MNHSKYRSKTLSKDFRRSPNYSLRSVHYTIKDDWSYIEHGYNEQNGSYFLLRDRGLEQASSAFKYQKGLRKRLGFKEGQDLQVFTGIQGLGVKVSMLVVNTLAYCYDVDAAILQINSDSEDFESEENQNLKTKNEELKFKKAELKKKQKKLNKNRVGVKATPQKPEPKSFAHNKAVKNREMKSLASSSKPEVQKMVKSDDNGKIGKRLESSTRKSPADEPEKVKVDHRKPCFICKELTIVNIFFFPFIIELTNILKHIFFITFNHTFKIYLHLTKIYVLSPKFCFYF
jgi:hypothetical protein